jgi:hypothetical protein
LTRGACDERSESRAADDDELRRLNQNVEIAACDGKATSNAAKHNQEPDESHFMKVNRPVWQ